LNIRPTKLFGVQFREPYASAGPAHAHELGCDAYRLWREHRAERRQDHVERRVRKCERFEVVGRRDLGAASGRGK